MKIFKDPRDAIGYKIQYYTWETVYFRLEGIDKYDNKVIGTYVNKQGKEERTTYNLCKGITKGEKHYDYWHIIDYKNFGSLPDELFEI
jgi:hypothetical protein